MMEFKFRVALYKFLCVPNLLAAHWCDSSGWIMANYLYKQIWEETKTLIQSVGYIAVTVDEVTTVDNNNFLSIRAYIVQNWVRIPLLISLQRVECSSNVENLTEMIVGAINLGGGLDSKAIANKLMSLGANGALTLQGARSRVTQQVKEKHAPFLIDVHCVAHRCNLAFKALTNLGMFGDIEKLLLVTYGYLYKSSKRYSEFKQLAELTQTKGLKMLHNVQMRWVSLIELLCGFLSEYRTLIYKTTDDLNENSKAEVSVLQLPTNYFSLSIPIIDLFSVAYLCCVSIAVMNLYPCQLK